MLKLCPNPNAQRYGKRSTTRRSRSSINSAVDRLRAEGATVAEAAKQIEVSEQTYYRWRCKYAKMDKPQLKRLKELEKENARLKKLVAEQTLDIDILKEVTEGKY